MPLRGRQHGSRWNTECSGEIGVFRFGAEISHQCDCTRATSDDRRQREAIIVTMGRGDLVLKGRIIRCEQIA